FSRKLRPRKYDEGSALDSERSDLRSTRAAIHPMPKKTGRARSHQNSKSMDLARRVAVAGLAALVGRLAASAVSRALHGRRFRARRGRRGRHARELRGGLPEPHDLTPLVVTRCAFLVANQTMASRTMKRTIQTSACMEGRPEKAPVIVTCAMAVPAGGRIPRPDRPSPWTGRKAFAIHGPRYGKIPPCRIMKHPPRPRARNRFATAAAFRCTSAPVGSPPRAITP